MLLAVMLAAGTLWSQPSGNVVVDKQGVMRWEKTKEEVRGFGVNYTAMFAHAYRTAQKRGISVEKAIDEDVYHFTRLGFDLYRVHVWDTEISDTAGNLIVNEHLRLFDYALARMKERGFRFIITPIAFWGNGWPEPDDKTPGFSAKYGKDACLTNPAAIRAQQNYLKQFVSHVNPGTGLAYKDDPAILAFEVSNEPHHREAPEKVTAFIKGMMDAMRSTGCKKPIFYNVSHSIHLAEAYAKAGIQGGTFQWYPTGLGSGHELGGNLLPNVDRYTIPFAASPSYKKMAKVVYEFDAADVGRSYIYPAMARSFRTAGIQVATHFAYDPTYMADVNTEYGTHFMNLAYAPQKALSLKIAGEVFRRVPMNTTYGAYPASARFGPFALSYEKDLAEMVTETEFYHTNHTDTPPPSPEKLQHIAGWGDSPVVKYEGTGAYFLDRLEPGVWRLEVMPDVVWISDPFAPASPRKKVAVIQWNEWPLSVKLPDLGDSFEINGVNKGNVFQGKSAAGSFRVKPGTYVLRKQPGSSWKSDDRWNTITVGEFAAPTATVTKLHLVHQPPVEVQDGSRIELRATVVGPSIPSAVEVHVQGQGRRGAEIVPMVRNRNFEYTASVQAFTGYLRYFLVVRGADGARTFPADAAGLPWDWDFFERKPYEVPVAAGGTPVILFDAKRDAAQLSRTWLPGSGLVPVDGGAELHVPVKQLFTRDDENPQGERVADYSMRFFFGKNTGGRRADLEAGKTILLSARSLNDKPTPLQIALISRRGEAYGTVVKLAPGDQVYSIPISDLRPVSLVTLPRPYPTFLPYYFKGGDPSGFSWSEMETLQFSIGPGLSAEESQQPQGVAIRQVRVR